MIRPKKSEILILRIDPATKQALQKAAAFSNMSASAFALIGIKELLREGETHVILPEYMRLSRTEKERQRQQSLEAIRKILRERKQRQAKARANKIARPY